VMPPQEIDNKEEQITMPISLPFFEGTEKRLELVFSQNLDEPQGFRKISTEEWNQVLHVADCLVLSDSTQSSAINSYILSQSSLFVTPFRVVLKTCGTSSLLHVIPLLMEHAKKLNTKIETVFFSHQNYVYPDRQPAPHHDIVTEAEYLQQYFPGQLKTLGSMEDGCHWSFFTNNRVGTQYPVNHSLHSLEIMMSELDKDVMKQFHYFDGDTTPKLLARTGISNILLGCDQVDGYIFQPWGFSMNALKDDIFVTIHVTPEDHGSYVSYETNLSFHSLDELRATIRKVLEVFKPGKFCIVTAHEDMDLRNEEDYLQIPHFTRKQCEFLLVDRRDFHFFEFFK